MNYILNYGKNVLKLSKIYWCVEIDNNRAVSFYDKNGYQRVDKNDVNHEGYTMDQVYSFIWYQKNF